jgi:hypothetical protein
MAHSIAESSEIAQLPARPAVTDEPVPAQPPPRSHDAVELIADAIMQLTRLQDAGLISEAEYDSKRTELLSRI